MTAPRITLRTLAEASEQAVFDQIALHMLTQRATSFGADDMGCAYRGQNGLQCAGGCVIGDDEYSPEMETRNWPNLIEQGLVPAAHGELIRAMQCIHDDDYPEDWERRLRALAATRGLQMPEVPACCD